jgi:hypothetical protein
LMSIFIDGFSGTRLRERNGNEVRNQSVPVHQQLCVIPPREYLAAGTRAVPPFSCH